MDNSEISIEMASKLLQESNGLFTEVFKHGTLSVEFYKPKEVAPQTPHDRDEVYIVASGSGIFNNGGKRWNFKRGDFLFVPAGTETPI